jgi:hypothetical protein
MIGILERERRREGGVHSNGSACRVNVHLRERDILFRLVVVIAESCQRK